MDEGSLSRRRQDTGRAAQAWRWFSTRTARSAERYRDLGWAPLLRHLAVALAIIAIARIFRTEGFAPFALVIGGVWMLALLRIALIKAFDPARD